MRFAARIDPNHADIVQALRAAGCTVLELKRAGKGVPDLLVGARGETYLLEVKAPGRLSAGAKRSLERQQQWAGAWRGRPVAFVTSVDEALQAVGAVTGAR